MRVSSLPCALSLVALSLGAGCAQDRVDPYAATDAGVTPDAATHTPDGGTAHDTGAEASTDSGPVVDAGTPVDTGSMGTDAGVVCRPNNDFVITRDEAPFIVGATVTYVINTDGSTVTGISTAGTPEDGGAGGRLWDFTQPTPQDHRVLEEVMAPTGQWWTSQYTDASFATLLDRATDLYGIYRATPTALQLEATVSHQATGGTDLAMSPAVDVLRYPLMEGLTWTQTVTGTGLYSATPLTNTNVYTFTVDAHGQVWTTAGRFPVLRVRTDLTQSIPLTTITRTVRSYTWLAECWGVVAKATSADNETAVEFTRATEFRRLSL